MFDEKDLQVNLVEEDNNEVLLVDTKEAYDKEQENILSRRSYDRSFKIDAVRKQMSSEKSVDDMSRELGVSKTNLFRWKNRFKNIIEEESRQRYREEAKLDEELQTLRDENFCLKEENEILRKTIKVISSKGV